MCGPRNGRFTFGRPVPNFGVGGKIRADDFFTLKPAFTYDLDELGLGGSAGRFNGGVVLVEAIPELGICGRLRTDKDPLFEVALGPSVNRPFLSEHTSLG